MSKGKLLAVSIVWLLVVVAAAVAWKFLVVPWRQETAEEDRQSILGDTSASSRYRHTISLALDSFSGYAVLRSKEFDKELANRRIRLTLVDDGADYQRRMQSLADGSVQMAAFTIDALLKVSAQRGDLPATIVALIDETRGADAMLAYKRAVPDLDALNRADTQLVVIPNSPSETLARVLMNRFQLDNLQPNPFIPAQDAADVYRRFKAADRQEPLAFVLWEPYVSKILAETPEAHVLVDSSQFRGYIVDCLVVNRQYLRASEPVVRDVVAAYFRAAHQHREKMLQLVMDDARAQKTPLSQTQAEKLVGGVWWKNTQENFAHMGLRDVSSIMYLEDIVENISDVLVETGAIAGDPTQGQPNTLFYDGILRNLKESDFHPGATDEEVRDDQVAVKRLSDAQWQALAPVGTLDVPQLVFARGSDRLTSRSQAVLDELVLSLANWPRYYLLIRGNASRRGDLSANKQLAAARAQAAKAYLIQAGVEEDRVQALGIEPSGKTSVSFLLGQAPY